MTDVSLLVEWESVQGAEYYVLTYYPKNDEGAQEQVGFSTLIISVSNTGCSKKKKYITYFILQTYSHQLHIRFRSPTQRTPTSSQD